jgi:putative transposase
VFPSWIERLEQLVEQYLTFWYPHLWAFLRGQTERCMNKKAVYRVLK